MSKPYVWWHCSDLMDLFTMVVKEGADHLRLEYHEDEPESLRLVSEDTGETCGSYNLSHTCPPDCD